VCCYNVAAIFYRIFCIAVLYRNVQPRYKSINCSRLSAYCFVRVVSSSSRDLFRVVYRLEKRNYRLFLLESQLIPIWRSCLDSHIRFSIEIIEDNQESLIRRNLAIITNYHEKSPLSLMITQTEREREFICRGTSSSLDSNSGLERKEKDAREGDDNENEAPERCGCRRFWKITGALWPCWSSFSRSSRALRLCS